MLIEASHKKSGRIYIDIPKGSEDARDSASQCCTHDTPQFIGRPHDGAAKRARLQREMHGTRRYARQINGTKVACLFSSCLIFSVTNSRRKRNA
jgi:hypothetical protein